VAWKEGVIIESKDTPLNFVKIEKLMPKAPKSLKEARGFVVAEYQEHLEKIWIEELKGKYKLDIDQKVLSSIIK
jgi:peptidyl-prolyl cis-trans isomerase SurA